MAISNPCGVPYVGDVQLRTADGRMWRRTFSLPAHGSHWGPIRDLFPGQPTLPESDSNALLWFAHNQRLMVWFFWHKVADNLWIVQHH